MGRKSYLGVTQSGGNLTSRTANGRTWQYTNYITGMVAMVVDPATQQYTTVTPTFNNAMPGVITPKGNS